MTQIILTAPVPGRISLRCHAMCKLPVMAACALAVAGAFAEEPPRKLDEVTVTATREARLSGDVPQAIAATIRALNAVASDERVPAELRQEAAYAAANLLISDHQDA